MKRVFIVFIIIRMSFPASAQELSPKPKISINGNICSIGYEILTCATKTCDSTVINAGDSVEFCTVEPFTQLNISGYWIEWDFPGSNIPQETDSAVMPTPICYYPKWTTGGTYQVDVYYLAALATCCCASIPSQWTTKIVVVPVGINESGKEEGVEAYPNPSSGIISVRCPMTDDGRLEIYNVMGKLIFTSVVSRQTSVIDLRSKSKGIYFLRVQMAGEISVKKIMLE